MCNLWSKVVVIYEERWGDRGGRNKGDHSSVSDEIREKTRRGRKNMKEKERVLEREWTEIERSWEGERKSEL